MTLAEPDVHLDPGSLAEQMARDVRAGLSARPLTLPPKYFYDARGSELFDQITRLPEYYPTRTERAILEQRWAIVGMGININQTFFPENIRNAVSLKQITGKHYDVVGLARELCTHVQNRYTQLVAGRPLLPEYNQHLFKKEEDQKVTLKKGSRVFEATIKEVTAADKWWSTRFYRRAFWIWRH